MRFESMAIQNDGTYVFTEKEHEGGRTATVNLVTNVITGVSGKRLKSIPDYYLDMCVMAFPLISLDTFCKLLDKGVGYGTLELRSRVVDIADDIKDEVESFAKIMYRRSVNDLRAYPSASLVTAAITCAAILVNNDKFTRNEKVAMANDTDVVNHITNGAWHFRRFLSTYMVTHKIKTRLHGNVSTTTIEFVKKIFNEISNLTDVEEDAILKGAQHGTLDNIAYAMHHTDFHVTRIEEFGKCELFNSAVNLVKVYINACRYLKETPSFTGNFINKCAAALRECYNRKDEAFKNYQTFRNLHFEDDNFVVIVPLTIDELVKEGEAQHNCVGTYGYDREVMNRERNIVFIREKDNPDASYITCEIYSDGEIGQYLYAHNQDVGDDEPAMNFCKKYGEYLQSIW